MVTTTPAVACAYFNRDGNCATAFLSKTPLTALRSQVRRGSNNTKGQASDDDSRNGANSLSLCARRLFRARVIRVMKME